MAARLYLIGSLAGALAGLALTSCEKELDFKYHDIDPILVIEGAVEEGGAKVSLTLTTPMDEPMDRRRLTDATVILDDLTVGATVELAPGEGGDFLSPVPGVPGHDYRLTVTRGGETRTALTRMYHAVEITDMKFNWIKMPYDDVATLQISFTDDPEVKEECYWVRVYRNGEMYMWNEVQDFMAVDGRIDEVFMTSRKDISEEDDDTVLVDGDVVTATVVRIDRRMHDYLEAIRNDSNGAQMFDGPLCVGYFTAGAVSSRSLTFHPADIPYFK